MISFNYNCASIDDNIKGNYNETTIEEDFAALEDNYKDINNIDMFKRCGICNFGFECILNASNEPIIVTIGASQNQYKRELMIFNCVTMEWLIKKNVRASMTKSREKE